MTPADGDATSFKALVVDFGGVLTTPLVDELVRFANQVGVDFQDLLRIALAPYAGGEDTLITDFETGKLSEEEFTTAFAERLRAAGARGVEPEGLIRRIFGGIRLEEKMLDALELARRARVRTALLSNSWGFELYPMERLKALFDAVVISGEVGMRKPEPAIFQLAADKLGLAPRDCLFVDDHPGHLQGAQAVGMATLLHGSPDSTVAQLEAIFGLSLQVPRAGGARPGAATPEALGGGKGPIE